MRGRFGVHEPEVHHLGVEAVGRVEVVGGDGDVMKRHRGIVDRALIPDTYDLGVVEGERALHEHDVDADPFVMFQRWYDDAVAHGALQPDAMIVATATADGRPSARAVLLRGVDDRGLCFFTNFDSRKGRELRRQPARRARAPLARGPAAGPRHRCASSASRIAKPTTTGATGRARVE